MPDATATAKDRMIRAGRPAGKLVSLEVARFVAAFLVAAGHEIGICILQNHPPFGTYNVSAVPPVMFFFVLSGFVMMTAHGDDFGRLGRVPRFYWRRAIRIFPIYWLSLFLIVGIGLACRQHYAGIDLFHAATLWPFQTFTTEVSAPAWTLRFEVAFYAMFGLCLLPYVGRPFLGLWIVSVFWIWLPSSWLFGPLTRAVGLGWWQSVPLGLRWHFFGFPEMYFFAGLAAGWLLRWRIPSAAAAALLVLALAGAIVSVHLAGNGSNYPTDPRTPFAAAAFAAAVLAVAALERNGTLRLGGKLAVLGALSYPLYLFHPIIIELSSLTPLHLLITHVFAWQYLFAMLAASLLLAASVTFLFDMPVQRRLRAPALHPNK